MLQLLNNLFHFFKHFGAAELGDDKVVGEERVTEGFWGSFGGWFAITVRVLEELKSEFGVFLESEERGESEGSDLQLLHECSCLIE